jgi:hypothetical protein
MNSTTATIIENGGVTAEIGYAVDTGEKPVNETFEAGQIIRRRTGATEQRPMPIRDGRTGEFSLDQQGFARLQAGALVNGEVPGVAAAPGALKIVNGRHPLLLAGTEPVIPFDLDLTEPERTLLISGPNTGGKTVLLTTHYLEEAEALCSRIAMLKQGRVVALDTTRNLLCGVAGVRLRLRLQPDLLPAALTGSLVAQEGNSLVLAVESYAHIEGVLAQLRVEGIEVQELEVLQADLEDVFVQMMRRH